MPYWIVRLIVFINVKLLFGLKVEGLNNLPKKSNFIIVANHTSFLDPLLMMAAVPKKIHCIALRNLFKIPWLRWFFGMTETFPSGNSSEKAISLLMQEKIVGLFPEGGISRDGKLREFKRGAALLALKTGRPIVPCAIFGAYEALPRSAKFPRFLPTKVKIGKPIYILKEFGETIEDDLLQEGIFRIKNAVKELLNAG